MQKTRKPRMFRSHESIQSLSSQSHPPYQITFRSLVLFHAPLPSKPKTFCRDTLENTSEKSLWESLTYDAAAGDWIVERFHESAEPFVKGKVANELKFSYTHARIHRIHSMFSSWKAYISSIESSKTLPLHIRLLRRLHSLFCWFLQSPNPNKK